MVSSVKKCPHCNNTGSWGGVDGHLYDCEECETTTEPARGVSEALDSIENALMSLSMEERDCYKSGFSGDGVRLANIGSQIGAAIHKIRTELTNSKPVNHELLAACKKAADIFRDYERIHLYKNPPDRAKAERNGEYAYVMEKAIARAEHKGGV